MARTLGQIRIVILAAIAAFALSCTRDANAVRAPGVAARFQATQESVDHETAKEKAKEKGDRPLL